MKTLKFSRSLMFFAAIAVSATSCMFPEDPGPIREVEQDFDHADFDRLEMGDDFNLVVTQGSEYSIHVKGDERNLEDLRFDQDGSKLRIHYRHGGNFSNWRRHETFITITMPSLKSADLSGSVDSDISGFTEDDFSLSLSGASDANLAITANTAYFDLSGSSDVDVIGSAIDLDVELSGASSFNGLEFQVENAKLDLSGSSDVKVNVTTSLSAKASGSSNVIYRGTPAINSTMSGSSSIGQE